MGAVYRALDTRLDRMVAIKIRPTHIASDPHVRERFHREARTISQLNNSHICALHDIGDTVISDGGSTAEPVSFLVLEYLEGQTLAERLRHGPLRVAEAGEVALQIVQALREAHRHGIVHRDLKPANVMLIDESWAAAAAEPIDQDRAVLVKLLDFGLAKAATESRPSAAGAL